MFINTEVNVISTAANTHQVHGRDGSVKCTQLRMTGRCCGLFIKQKQLKKPTEECFKQQFLPRPPLLASFQSPLVIIIVRNTMRCPFPLSLSSRRALPARGCASSHWKAATAGEGEQRHSPRPQWRNQTSIHQHGVTFFLPGRQQPRGWKHNGPLRAIHQPSPIVPEHELVPEQTGAEFTKPGMSHLALTPAQQLFSPREGGVSACQQRPHPRELWHRRTLTKPIPALLHIAKSPRSTTLASGKDFWRCM